MDFCAKAMPEPPATHELREIFETIDKESEKQGRGRFGQAGQTTRAEQEEHRLRPEEASKSSRPTRRRARGRPFALSLHLLLPAGRRGLAHGRADLSKGGAGVRARWQLQPQPGTPLPGQVHPGPYPGSLRLLRSGSGSNTRSNSHPPYRPCALRLRPAGGGLLGWGSGAGPVDDLSPYPGFWAGCDPRGLFNLFLHPCSVPGVAVGGGWQLVVCGVLWDCGWASECLKACWHSVFTGDLGGGATKDRPVSAPRLWRDGGWLSSTSNGAYHLRARLE